MIEFAGSVIESRPLVIVTPRANEWHPSSDHRREVLPPNFTDRHYAVCESAKLIMITVHSLSNQVRTL